MALSDDGVDRSLAAVVTDYETHRHRIRRAVEIGSVSGSLEPEAIVTQGNDQGLDGDLVDFPGEGIRPHGSRTLAESACWNRRREVANRERDRLRRGVDAVAVATQGESGHQEKRLEASVDVEPVDLEGIEGAGGARRCRITHHHLKSAAGRVAGPIRHGTLDGRGPDREGAA